MTLVEAQKLHAENVQAVQDAQSAQLAEPSLEKAKLRRKSLMQTNGKCQEKEMLKEAISEKKKKKKKNQQKQQQQQQQQEESRRPAVNDRGS